MAFAEQSLGEKILKEDLAAAKLKSSGIYVKDAVLSSGNYWVDKISGSDEGLFPRGAITEIGALKGSGKTTLANACIAYNQWMCSLATTQFNVLYVDFEHNLVAQQDYMRSFGVDLGDPGFFYRQPKSFEGGFQFIVECLRDPSRKRHLGIDAKLDLVVVDTLGAARPIIEIDNKIGGTAKPGYKGKLASEAMRNIQAELSGGPAVVIINHMVEVIDFGGFNPSGKKRYDTNASNALKLYAAQRYMMAVSDGKSMKREVTDPDTFKKEIERYSSYVEIECEKSKIGPPFRKGHFFLTPMVGVDQVATLLEVAEAKNTAHEEAEKKRAGTGPGYALYIGANNTQYGVHRSLTKEQKPDKDSCVTKPVVGRYNFLDFLRTPEAAIDRAQLGANTTPLWKKQMDTHYHMQQRIAAITAAAGVIDPNKGIIQGEDTLIAEGLAAVEAENLL